MYYSTVVRPLPFKLTSGGFVHAHRNAASPTLLCRHLIFRTRHIIAQKPAATRAACAALFAKLRADCACLVLTGVERALVCSRDGTASGPVSDGSLGTPLAVRVFQNR